MKKNRKKLMQMAAGSGLALLGVILLLLPLFILIDDVFGIVFILVGSAIMTGARK